MKNLPRILAIIVGGYFVLGKLSKEGILGLLGYETMKSVHTFITKSPDGRIRSQFRESMDGNDAVRVEIERLNDHSKMSNRMSISEWKEFYNRVKDYIEPGTDKVEYYSHQGKEMEDPFKDTSERTTTPTPTPFKIDTLKDVAGLIGSPKAEWLRVFGDPVRETPPRDKIPRDAGETDWDFNTIEMDVSWIQTKEGVLPVDIAFVPIGGEPDLQLSQLDLITQFFGLSRSKSDDREGDYEWNRADGSVSAWYSKWESDIGLHISIEKPGGEPVPPVDKGENSPANKK